MDNQLPWYNPTWLLPETWNSFTWDMKEFLWGAAIMAAVLVLRIVIRELAQYRHTQKLPIAVTEKEFKSSPLNYIRLIPDLLLIISLGFLFIAMARPQKTNEKVEQWTEGIDIMLALDISESMTLQDFSPNRLEAAKKVATEFVNGRKQDRIGLVVFSGDAFSLAPLTSDYDLLRQYIKELTYELIESKGTAIGSALAVVTNRMQESTAKSKVCILLSDGTSNAGNIDPITAADIAAGSNIKIYTILVGKEGPVPRGTDFFGNPVTFNNTVDESTMRKIAEIGSGEFFRATNNQALEKVFERIDQYEKAEIKETRFQNTTDFYVVYLNWGIVFFLLWLMLKSTFVTSAIRD